MTCRTKVVRRIVAMPPPRTSTCSVVLTGYPLERTNAERNRSVCDLSNPAGSGTPVSSQWLATPSRNLPTRSL